MMHDVSVNLARPVLADRRIGQRQEIQIGAVVGLVTHFATGQHRLQRERPAERQRHIRIRRGGQAMIHHVGDEARHAQQRVRYWARIGISSWRRQWTRVPLAHQMRQIDFIVARRLTVSVGPQRRGSCREVTIMAGLPGEMSLSGGRVGCELLGQEFAQFRSGRLVRVATSRASCSRKLEISLLSRLQTLLSTTSAQTLGRSWRQTT